MSRPPSPTSARGNPVSDQDKAAEFFVGSSASRSGSTCGCGRLRWVTVAAPGASTSVALIAGPDAGNEIGIRFMFSMPRSAYGHAAAGHRGRELVRWPGDPAMFKFQDPDRKTFEIVEASAEPSRARRCRGRSSSGFRVVYLGHRQETRHPRARQARRGQGRRRGQSLGPLRRIIWRPEWTWRSGPNWSGELRVLSACKPASCSPLNGVIVPPQPAGLAADQKRGAVPEARGHPRETMVPPFPTA